MEKQVQHETVAGGMRAALPTALGYISIGLAFGVVAAGAGLTALEVGLLSLLVYGGSAQFAFVSLLSAGAPLYSLVVTVGLVNLRNMLMSLHAATLFRTASLWQAIGIGTLMTDESYGVLLAEQAKVEQVSVAWMYGNNVLSYVAWCGATVIGALMGSLIPNPERIGLDFALVAMFLGLLMGQVEHMKKTTSARKLTWILATVALSFFLLSAVLSSSLAVLAATLLGCGMGVYLDEH